MHNPARGRRHSLRLRGYDYSQEGAYFVTTCTHNRASMFGEIVDGQMQLNALGQIVEACWQETPEHFRDVQVDVSVVMPNHMHGILWITNRRGTACRAPTCEQFGKPTSQSLPTVIRSFKSAVTKRVNLMRGTPGSPLWQRNYYEHVVRDDAALNRIRDYIQTNPQRWRLDRENPERSGEDAFDRWLTTSGAQALISGPLKEDSLTMRIDTR